MGQKATYPYNFILSFTHFTLPILPFGSQKLNRDYEQIRWNQASAPRPLDAYPPKYPSSHRSRATGFMALRTA